jgi:hypothetical protein
VNDHDCAGASMKRETEAIPASELLRDFMAGWEADRVHLRDIVEALQDRAYGLLLLVFAFPIVIPNPIPGVSGVLGIPLILVSAQLALGRPRPWFPAFIGDRSIRSVDFARMLDKVLPWLRRIEKLATPRMTWLAAPLSERLVATFCLVLAIVLFLPIPLGNFLPALAISLIALGLIEHDGLAIMTGIVTGITGTVVASAVIVAMVEAFLFFLRQAF